MTDKPQRGRPVALDDKAARASRSDPAFVARPAGAPAYHGFVVLEDVVVDGFTLGKITDFEAETCATGDGFVIAPDGSRGGLIWEVNGTRYFQEVCALDLERWGVWSVGLPFPMTSRDNARKNLAAVLPD